MGKRGEEGGLPVPGEPGEADYEVIARDGVTHVGYRIADAVRDPRDYPERVEVREEGVTHRGPPKCPRAPSAA